MNQFKWLSVVAGALLVLGVQPGWAEKWRSKGMGQLRSEEVKGARVFTLLPRHPITDVRDYPAGIIHSTRKNSLSMSWARKRSAMVQES